MVVMIMSQRLNIPLIPQDLRHEELVLQIEACLSALQKASNNVFARIDSRIGAVQRDLEDVEQRAINARNKVQLLKSEGNRVIRIFSGSKYPEVYQEPYVSLYQKEKTSEESEPVVSGLKINSGHVPFDDEVIREKLQFYHFPRVGEKAPQILNVSDNDNPLGRIPWERITSVGSLVMFNSSENPYVRRSYGSSSLHEQKLRRKVQIHGDENDGFAPVALIQNQRLDEDDGEDGFLRYNPDLEPAPAIIDLLPEALPDLQGVAGDLFSSAFQFPDSGSLFQTVVSASPQLTIAAPSIQATSTPVLVPVPSMEKPVSSNQMPLPPPPPPPPPPAFEAPATPIESTQVPSAPAADGGRASLLDAIRQAGGRPKKGPVSMKDLKIEKKKNKQKEVVTGDLMADLAKTLTSRRVGISGANRNLHEKPKEPGSALERMASMIPAPPKPTTSESPEDEDSDWE